MDGSRYYPDVKLEETIGALAPRVLRYCYSRTSDWGLAEDVAQDALAAVVHRWRRGGPPESPIGFAITVARRRLARRAVRRRATEALEYAGPELHDPRADPERRATAGRELDLALRGLGQLSPLESEALRLVALAELPYAEAAEQLGVSESALKMRVSRARTHLKEVLSNGHRP